jgi:hypothetical protein
VRSGDQQVVPTLPAGARFGIAARSAVGELARRAAFSAPQWARLEAAVDRTLDLLERHPGDRVRLTFGGHAHAISVQAELTTERARPVGGRSDARRADVVRLRTDPADLVEAPEVDADGARVRFHARY